MFEPYLGRFPELIRTSNSEIQQFKSDRRLWYLGSYLGLQKVEKSLVGPLPLGSRLHDALEEYYTTGENPCDKYNRLLRVDTELFYETMDSEDEKLVKKFNSEAELGRIMLEGYLEWIDEENMDAKFRVIGAEKILSYKVPELDNRIELQGKLDLRIERKWDGSIAAFDHKSAVAFEPYRKFAHLSEQLMLYTSLERFNLQDPNTYVDGGVYNLLKKVKRTAAAKPPFYERIDVRFNDKTLDSFWTRTLGTLKDMLEVRDALDNGADHRFVCYPTPTMDWKTGSSPFFPVYSMLDDGSDAWRYLEDNFVQGDPYERYNDKGEI